MKFPRLGYPGNTISQNRKKFSLKTLAMKPRVLQTSSGLFVTEIYAGCSGTKEEARMGDRVD